MKLYYIQFVRTSDLKNNSTYEILLRSVIHLSSIY